MPLVELSEGEHFVLEVLRNFSFLHDFGYKNDGALIYFHERGVDYVNWHIYRQISIQWWSYEDYLCIYFYDTRGFWKRISIHDLYSYYKAGHRNNTVHSGNYADIVKENADFMKRKLMPIVKGEKWIKELSCKVGT